MFVPYFKYRLISLLILKMPARKKSPSSMLTSISKRPNKSVQTRVRKLTNLSNLKTNTHRELENRQRELEKAKRIIMRARAAGEKRLVAKMMREMGYQRLNNP
tara:strand:- start:73 stop:381 length:309 start_codon:yes stop_codon:yes gene_type:complete